ncbi:hypothetical protein [Streptomyces sp. Ac-502]|uniref:hypothetical protein n=1 Tax=Streptomyces sp. Ac-502 TaxID=3342801 RepID=UPI00386262AB
MLSRPRSLFFWLVLIIVLFIIASAPAKSARALLAAYHGVVHFFESIQIFVSTLGA